MDPGNDEVDFWFFWLLSTGGWALVVMSWIAGFCGRSGGCAAACFAAVFVRYLFDVPTSIQRRPS
jgi:hypothetical protein